MKYCAYVQRQISVVCGVSLMLGLHCEGHCWCLVFKNYKQYVFVNMARLFVFWCTGLIQLPVKELGMTVMK